MEFLMTPLTDMEVWAWEEFLGDWFFVGAIGLFLLELLRYALFKTLSWNLIGDAVANYVTLAMYLGLGFFVYGALYVGAYFTAYEFALFDIEINWATIAICVVLADLAYYWEHRFTHRVNLAWATHSVHHSSPHFNISVAYRYGPMDDLWPILFHIPLCLIGFNPFVVFFSEMVVQLYQTALHTEAVKKLPRPIEAIMNTPSHHRVHHGSNPEYLDKNYASIFIIWDRLFGTFAEEREKVVYGLVRPIDSVNPIVVFCHGLYRLGHAVATTPGFADKLGRLLRHPGWEPGDERRERAPASAE